MNKNKATRPQVPYHNSISLVQNVRTSAVTCFNKSFSETLTCTTDL